MIIPSLPCVVVKKQHSAQKNVLKLCYGLRSQGFFETHGPGTSHWSAVLAYATKSLAQGVNRTLPVVALILANYAVETKVINTTSLWEAASFVYSKRESQTGFSEYQVHGVELGAYH